MNRRARAGRELVVPERFHEEVVSAVFDFRQRRRQRGIGGDDDDGDVPVQRVVAERPADLQPRDIRRGQIDEDEIEGLGRSPLQRRESVAHGLARVPIGPQARGHGIAKASFVLDQQNALARWRVGFNHGRIG